jgi:CSLREA domain-containing protein
VTKYTDTRDGTCNSDCSLREAIDQANGDATADTIQLGAGVYRVDLAGVSAEELNASGDLDVTADLTISGAGAGTTTVEAILPAPPSASSDRVIDQRGGFTDLTLLDLTVAGGRAFVPSGFGYGGGIRSDTPGELVLRRVVVRDNQASGQASGGEGGGVFKARGHLVIENSAISGNKACCSGFGGGVFLEQVGTTADLTNVSIVGNESSYVGGGVYSNNSIAANLTNVTIIGNKSLNTDGGLGGDVSGFRARSSIVAGNTSPADANCTTGSGLASDGGNVGDPVCGFTQPTDARTLDAQLGAFGGTPIPVAEPLPGSPAIDRAVGVCPATDARGVSRPQGVGCDAGAAELPDTTAPVASALTFSPRGFAALTGRGASIAAKPKRGTTVSFNLTEAATTVFAVSRRTAGRKKGKNCVTGRKALKLKGKRCFVYKAVRGTFSHAGASGANSFKFTGRVNNKPLPPGGYTLSGVPTDRNGNAGAAISAKFKIVKPR